MDTLRTEAGSAAPHISEDDESSPQAWQNAVQGAATPPPPTDDAAKSADAASPATMGRLADRQALAARLVKPGNEATEADISVVRDHLAQTMPLSEMRTLDTAGVTIQVTRGDITHQIAALRDQHPRDYRPGATWRGRPGTYWAPTKSVVVATQDGPNGSRIMPGQTLSSSVDVLLHESGHALNRTSIFANRSEGDAFQAAYKADGPMSGKLADEYYHQTASPAAGRDEAYAESSAMFLTQPAELKADAPHVYDYWARQYAQ
jgi:hypothetical protein